MHRTWVCCFVVLCCGGLYTSGELEDNNEITTKKECLTDGCKLAADKILESIDETVDPCEDFYSFACGGFLNRTVIPDDRQSMSQLTIMSIQLANGLRKILEEDISPSEPNVFKMAKTLYKSCMDTSQIEDLGITPILEVVDDLGGMPLLSPNWTGDNFLWYEMIYKFGDIGLPTGHFLNSAIGEDFRNTSVRIISVDQTTLINWKSLIPSENHTRISAYLEYLVDMAVALGANETEAETQMADLIQFELQLGTIIVPQEERRDFNELYRKMSIQELSIIYPDIPWLNYFQRLTRKLQTITEDEPIVLYTSDAYLHNLTSLLDKVPKRTLANYLIFKAIESRVKCYPKKLRDIQLKHKAFSTGVVAEQARWEECVEIVGGSLSSGVSSLYVSKFFKNSAKAMVEEMDRYIRAELDDVLDKVEWMDSVTRSKAKLKLKSMSSHIGYPDELLNVTMLEEVHEGLDIREDQYLRNSLQMNTFGTKYLIKKLRKPVKKNDWEEYSPAAAVNAYYVALKNTMEFPAGILQGVFFNEDRPKYLNFGAIGFIIAHEVTHAFDDRGRQFDHEGVLFDWWDEKTSESFKKRAQCIIDQFNNYTVPEINMTLNGIITQGENIADIGGLKRAYKGYQTWASHYKPEDYLPGLEYTPNQLFWISFANALCEKTRPKSLKLSVLTSSHPPGRFRVNGALSNVKEFLKDFNCPIDAPMNRKYKCEVW